MGLRNRGQQIQGQLKKSIQSPQSVAWISIEITLFFLHKWKNNLKYILRDRNRPKNYNFVTQS